MMWVAAVVGKYRRLRALADGQSFGRVEALARAVADAERDRRFPPS